MFFVYVYKHCLPSFGGFLTLFLSNANCNTNNILEKCSQFWLVECSALSAITVQICVITFWREKNLHWKNKYGGQAPANSANISLKFEVNLILLVKCPLTELEESQCYKLTFSSINERTKARVLNQLKLRGVNALPNAFSCTLLIGNRMISREIWNKTHSCFFWKSTNNTRSSDSCYLRSLRNSLVRIVFQIPLEIMILLIQIYSTFMFKHTKIFLSLKILEFLWWTVTKFQS